jgi:carboxyl-terminal processing protease
MLTKRNLPIAILALMTVFTVSFRSDLHKRPPTKYERILHDVGEMLQEIHYSPRNIDDSFSREVFKKYLASVDQEKKILLQTDIDGLGRFANTIDDEINGKAPIQFVHAVNEIYLKRLQESELLYKEILSHSFDFTTDEYVDLNPDRLGFPKNDAERAEGLRKRLKFLALEKYTELLEIRAAHNKDSKDNKDSATSASAAGNNPAPALAPEPSLDSLERLARQRAVKAMDLYYSRLKVKASEDQRFNEFVEIIVQCEDPHTDYFPPVEKRSFDEDMSGRFFGIGAGLKDEEGVIKIASLMTGSPAWKSGRVKEGDAILKVAQGNDEPVDLTGYQIPDAVKIIRGAKGTVVKLTLKTPDGTIRTISLVREEIVQDEKFARSVIVTTEKGRIGYIFLPEFYADFENQNGNRCFVDVAKELIKLKELKVDGVVLDLRNNPGGSLGDVVEMVGLFIDQGPVVQVKGREGRPIILEDHEKGALYNGPLAVMVNEFSASASEIFAAAIQDYKRGVIIGSTSTFGKGTVQRPFPLDKSSANANDNTGLGTIKLTMEKFYRVNGGSTQQRGVASDIVLPDVYEHSKFREKDQPDALPWDEITKANYTPCKSGYDINTIKNSSHQRISNNDTFRLIQKDADWLDQQSNRLYSLNLDKYRQQQRQTRDTITKVEGLSKLSHSMNVAFLPQDLSKFEQDKAKSERYKAWLKNLGNDIYLNETVNVMGDMIGH